MASVLQSASRESLSAATARLDSHVDATGASDLSRLAEDLFAVLGLLEREHALRRALADPATPAASRTGLADRLLSGKVGRPALDLVSDLVSSRWSRNSDLLEALESLARNAAFGVAEKDGSLDRVEDELFRFGRILDREPELARLLSDSATPADKRVELLREVLTDHDRDGIVETLVDRVRSVVGDDEPPAWSRRSRRRCWSRPCAPGAAATSTWWRRSSPSSPRPVATATWPTSAPPYG